MPATANIVSIYIGVPEAPKKVNVDAERTLADVVAENVQGQGLIQHNGVTIQTSKLNYTLTKLGVVDGDNIFVVKKLDNA